LIISINTDEHKPHYKQPESQCKLSSTESHKKKRMLVLYFPICFSLCIVDGMATSTITPPCAAYVPTPAERSPTFMTSTTHFPRRLVPVDVLTSRLPNGSYRFHPIFPCSSTQFLEGTNKSKYWPVVIKDTQPQTPDEAVYFTAVVEGFDVFVPPYGLSEFATSDAPEPRYTIQIPLDENEVKSEERAATMQMKTLVTWYYTDHLEAHMRDPRTSPSGSFYANVPVEYLREKLSNPLFPEHKDGKAPKKPVIKIQCKLMKPETAKRFHDNWEKLPAEKRHITTYQRPVYYDEETGVTKRAFYPLFFKLPTSSSTAALSIDEMESVNPWKIVNVKNTPMLLRVTFASMWELNKNWHASMEAAMVFVGESLATRDTFQNIGGTVNEEMLRKIQKMTKAAPEHEPEEPPHYCEEEAEDDGGHESSEALPSRKKRIFSDSVGGGSCSSSSNTSIEEDVQLPPNKKEKLASSSPVHATSMAQVYHTNAQFDDDDFEPCDMDDMATPA